MKFLIIFLMAVRVLACDATKSHQGTPDELQVTLAAGDTHVEPFDFSDCPYGITSEQFLVTAPRNSKGVELCLKPKPPITVELFDLTLGQMIGIASMSDTGCVVFYCIEGCGNVSGHVFNLVLAMDNSAKKPATVAITQAANWGGPP